MHVEYELQDLDVGHQHLANPNRFYNPGAADIRRLVDSLLASRHGLSASSSYFEAALPFSDPFFVDYFGTLPDCVRLLTGPNAVSLIDDNRLDGEVLQRSRHRGRPERIPIWTSPKPVLQLRLDRKRKVGDAISGDAAPDRTNAFVCKVIAEQYLLCLPHCTDLS